MLVLDDLIKKHHDTPYSKLHAKMPWYLRVNANSILMALPIALTAFLIYALWVSYFPQAPAGPDSSLIFLACIVLGATGCHDVRNARARLGSRCPAVNRDVFIAWLVHILLMPRFKTWTG